MKNRGHTEKVKMNSFNLDQQRIWQEKANKFKERIQNKREQLMFSKKLVLIERHLKDSNHPLRLLRKKFSEELKAYYDLFIEVNNGRHETNSSAHFTPAQETEQNEQKSVI